MSEGNRLVVCWGGGQDSSGMLVGMVERGIVPWRIVFADVGSERGGTYAFKAPMDAYLAAHGMPAVQVVRYVPKNFKHWPKYYSLLENCLTNVTLPSLAYGFHTCSAKWKISAINKWLASDPEAQAVWREGGRIDKAIGFDDTPWERQRAARGCATFATQYDEKDKYALTFPLQEWGWTREDCVAAIERAGMPVPPKSSCFFCPAMKPAEVDTLDREELQICVILEARVRQRHLDRAQEEGWPRGHGVPLIEGLWRRAVKGMRGATARPGSFTQYIREQGLLEAGEVDRLIAATPTRAFTQADFTRLGFANWREWLESILAPTSAPRFELTPEGEEQGVFTVEWSS